jgi:hypothetical protein
MRRPPNKGEVNAVHYPTASALFDKDARNSDNALNRKRFAKRARLTTKANPDRHRRKGARQDAECAEFFFFSESSAPPRESLRGAWDTRQLGGQVKPGHGECW